MSGNERLRTLDDENEESRRYRRIKRTQIRHRGAVYVQEQAE